MSRLLMALGLVAALCGDVCLAILSAPPRSALFLVGIGFFSLAHLLWMFAHRGLGRIDGRILFVAAIPLLMLTCGRLFFVLPRETALAVVFYTLVSTLDLSFAFGTHRQRYFRGVLLLVVSDVFIAARMLHVPGANFFVGPFYFAALVFLVLETFSRKEPKLFYFARTGRLTAVFFALMAGLCFLFAALTYPGGGYSPFYRMLSALGRTEIRTVAYPFCHYFFVFGMGVAALGTLRIGRDWGAAVVAAGLLSIAAMPENLSPLFHNAGCWIATAGGVVMFVRRRAWVWGALMGGAALSMAVFLLLHAVKEIPFAPYVPSAQKVVILLFAFFLVCCVSQSRREPIARREERI